MLNEEHIFLLFFCAEMLEDETQAELGWLQTRPEFIPGAGGASALSASFRLQTRNASPTLKILESVIKTNEKR